MKSRRLIASPEAYEHRLNLAHSPSVNGPTNVRFGSEADIGGRLRNVRFTPKSGLDQSGCNVRFVPKADIPQCVSSGELPTSELGVNGKTLGDKT
jgi:hypothetical protein